jgi:hypothetical protein
MIRKVGALAAIVMGMACPAMAGAGYGGNGGGITRADSLACVSRSSLEASRYDMNDKQLKSLGCTKIRAGITVHVLSPTDVIGDALLFVSAELPDQVIRFWIHRSDLTAVVGY